MTSADPRALQLAQHRQRIAHEAYGSTASWSNLRKDEQQLLVEEAAIWMRAAVETGIAPLAEQPAFDAEKALRDYAAVLVASDDPDANAWTAALMWAASRIHGGHQSIYAVREFVNRFGINPYPGSPA